MANSSAPVHTRFQLFPAWQAPEAGRESRMVKHPAGLLWLLPDFHRRGREGSVDRGAIDVLVTLILLGEG